MGFNRNVWRMSEDKIIRENYRDFGVSACLKLLPNRARSSLIGRAHRLGLNTTIIDPIVRAEHGAPNRKSRPIPDAELWRRREAMPADTRSITGIILGDPLPGRSALDMQSVEGGEA